MELAHAGSVIMRRMYLLVLGAICIGAIAYFASIRQPVTYTASAEVVVTLRPGEPITSRQINHAANLAQYYAKKSLPDAVVQTIYEETATRTPRQIRAELALSAIAGQPEISLVARDASPSASQVLANAAAVAFAEYYTQQVLASDASLAKKQADMQSQLHRIAADISQTQEALATAQAQHTDTTALQRELESLQAQQSQLNQQLSDVTQSLAWLPANLWVAKTATAPSRHGPTPVVNVAFGMAAGIFAGICLALLLDLLDGVVRVPDDIARFAGLPTIGIVRSASIEEDEPSAILLAEYSAVGDMSSGLMQNLAFLGATQPLKVLLVAPAGGGWSTDLVGIQLAISYALAGTRTLVVDANWTGPTLEARFGFPPAERGFFTSLVALGQNLDAPLDAVVSTAIPSLYALPIGPIPPNLDDLLSSSLPAELVAMLTVNFEQIVVLAPAELRTVAGQQLAGHMHGALVVARAGSTTGRQLADIAQSLRRAHCYLPGAVLVSENEAHPPRRMRPPDGVSPSPKTLRPHWPTAAKRSKLDSSVPVKRHATMTPDA